MSGDLAALTIGTLLAVGALAFVLYPLFFAAPKPRRAGVRPDRPTDDSAIVALREIEFDRATGKLSESDYEELRRAYRARALRELRHEPVALDPVEARVRAYRESHSECIACGLRPEPDAIYCSSCGRYLAGTCPDCGADVRESAATFCSLCGASLARSAVSARRAPTASARS